MTDNNQGILLESGTGELEVLQFRVQSEVYAINVVKVKEILFIENVAKVPNTHPAIPGVTMIRDEVITIVDMNYVLNNEKVKDITKQMVLVCEFNQLKVAFAIDEVVGITRRGWKDIKKPDDLTGNSLVIGNIDIDKRIVMLLDFEKIIMDISPESGITLDRLDHTEKPKKADANIVLADDSPMIRKVLKDTLTAAGFSNLRFFNDGQDAWDYLEGLANQFGDNYKKHVDLLITDIEMPNLDGHTLTRRVKEHRLLKTLPVIIFSSLISSDLRHKGDSVGADAQMSKPEVGKLIKIINSLL